MRNDPAIEEMFAGFTRAIPDAVPSTDVSVPPTKSVFYGPLEIVLMLPT